MKIALAALAISLTGSALAGASFLAGWHLAALLAETFLPYGVIRL